MSGFFFSFLGHFCCLTWDYPSSCLQTLLSQTSGALSRERQPVQVWEREIGGPQLAVSTVLCDVHINGCMHLIAASSQVKPH